jgi:hypothetical protein
MIRINMNKYLNIVTFIIDYTLKVIMKVINVHYDLVDLFILLNIITDEEGDHINLLEV